MKSKAIFSLLSAIVLSGCANFGMGEPDFACDAEGNGVSCMSAKEVYALTETPGPVTQARVDAANAKEQESTPQMTSGAWRESEKGKDQSTAAARHLPESTDPLPLRTPARVMRVWVAPWESQSGDLNVTGLVYTELEERQWTVGVPAVEQSSNLRPLQRRQAEMMGNQQSNAQEESGN